MRNTFVIVGMVLGFTLMVTPVRAQNDSGANVVAEKTQAVEVGNKICPVGGEKVGEMGEAIKHEYNGKIYNLCCPMCIKDFKKDPEKYSKIADEEVKKNVENSAGSAEGSEK
ncbi:MAG: TRASH domain-containing protein [Candidatus Omnitrophica bacterium]|nr:TRASH domain-containing protein [Candidatus Omnitrophota bacterium]